MRSIFCSTVKPMRPMNLPWLCNFWLMFVWPLNQTAVSQWINNLHRMKQWKDEQFQQFFLQQFQVSVFSVWLFGKISEIRKHIIASLKKKQVGTLMHLFLWKDTLESTLMCWNIIAFQRQRLSLYILKRWKRPLHCVLVTGRASKRVL